MRRLIIAAVVVLGVGLLGWMPVTDWLSAAQEIAVRERLVSQWQGMDLARRAIADRPTPDHWDAAVFVGADALNSVLAASSGARLEYVPSNHFLSGTTVTLDSVRVRPSVGSMGVELALRAKKGPLVLNLQAEGNLTFQGTARKTNGTAEALLRVEPAVLRPGVSIGWVDVSLRDFWSKLAPDLALALADPNLFVVRIPLKDEFALPLGFRRVETRQINDSGAAITYVIAMPEADLTKRVSFGTPVVTRDGLWLFGDVEKAGQQIMTVAAPPSREPAVLKQEIFALEQRLGSVIHPFAANGNSLALRVRRNVLSELAGDLAAKPDEVRHLSMRTISATGYLARSAWRDDVLGEGGTFAEVRSVDADIQFGRPDVGWNDGKLRLSLPIAMHASVVTHVHMDPVFLGGGVGGDTRVKGDVNEDLRVTGEVRQIESGQIRAVVLDGTPECKHLNVVVATNISVDASWIRTTVVGAKFGIPANVFDRFMSVPILDNREHFIEAKPQKVGKEKAWLFVPGTGAITVALEPSQAEGTETGFRFSAVVRVRRLNVEPTDEAIKAAHETNEKETDAYRDKLTEALASAQRPTGCSLKPTIAVLLGGTEFGPENEIIKLFTNGNREVGKLTRQAERLLATAGIKIVSRRLPLSPVAVPVPVAAQVQTPFGEVRVSPVGTFPPPGADGNTINVPVVPSPVPITVPVQVPPDVARPVNEAAKVIERMLPKF